MNKSCILFDVDGTLANLSHRLPFIKNGSRDWHSFFATVGEDSPIAEVIDVLDALWHRGQDTVFLVSGRSDVCRKETIEWLEKYDIPYDGLFMRAEGDYRPDTVVKQEMLQEIRGMGYDPWLAVEDRQRLARMWRSEGLLCLQCDDWEEREAEATKAKGSPTLYVLIGPSGAGKTTWVEDQLPLAYHISSDNIRYYANGGDFQCQDKNEQVFKAAHGMTRSLLLNGVDVAFDATNIRRKARIGLLSVVPEGTNVVYVVLNRSMEEKKKTAGWRPEWLLEKHEQTFKSNLKYILNGDGYDNIVVEDYRV